MPSIFQLTDNDRSIFFFEDVWQWSARSIISDLIRMNDEDKEKPISIFINSVGGSVIDMLGIIDVMKTIQAPINTFILGSAYSAASLIAACGNKGKRFISSNSQMMIHEAAMQGFGFIDTRDEKFTNALERVKQLNNRINTLYSQVTGKTFEEIDKLLSSKDDIFMSSDEAVKFGLVDEIMSSEQINSIKLSEKFKNFSLSESFALDGNDKDDKDYKTVHLLKVCSLKDRGIEITSDTIKSLIANFDNNVRGQDISIEYNTHENDDGENPAAAWIKELSSDEDNKNLFAKVKYSPTAEKMIEDREYKYISVEIDPLYQNENGKMFNNVLMGATFTNRPAVKGLKPLKLSENINNNKKIEMELNKLETASIENVKSKLNMKIEDIYDSFVAMTDKNIAIEKEKTELKSNLSKVEEKCEAAVTSWKKVVQETVESEKELAIDTLIAKGIIANVNKEKNLKQFSSKSEIDEFYKDAPAILSVKPKGSDAEEIDADISLAEEVSKQTGQSKEDIIKYGIKKIIT